jgi:hypothetical protein
MRSLLNLLCAAVLLGPVCAQELPKEASLYPLRKGAKWTYKSGDTIVEVAVTKAEKLEKDDVFELITSINNAQVASENIAVKPDGLYRVKVGGIEVKPPMPLLKFGGKKGDTWKIASAIGTSSETMTGEFARGETKVTWGDKKDLPAVTVIGAKMTANGQPVSLSYTFLDGVGPVAQSATLGTSTMTLTLTKYDPPKE